MTTYATAGALDRDGNRYPSKKALREALKANPSEVLFDITSIAFHPGMDNPMCADSIPADVSIQVAGPDPYANRRWFAKIDRTASGPKLS